MANYGTQRSPLVTLQVTSLMLHRMFFARIIVLAMTFAAIHHMCGAITIYICVNVWHMHMSFHVSTAGRGGLSFFFFIYFYTVFVCFFAITNIQCDSMGSNTFSLLKCVGSLQIFPQTKISVVRCFHKPVTACVHLSKTERYKILIASSFLDHRNDQGAFGSRSSLGRTGEPAKAPEASEGVALPPRVKVIQCFLASWITFTL